MSKKNMKAKATSKQGTKLALAEYVQRFGRDMGTAEEAFGRMAKGYAEAVKWYPSDAAREFKASYPQISAVQWSLLELVGNGCGSPRLMWLSEFAAARVLALRKPEQDKFFSGEKGVELYDPKTGGTRTVPYTKMRNADVYQAVDAVGKRVRTVEEQKEYFEAKKAAAEEYAARTFGQPYKVNGDGMEVFRACWIGQAEMRDALVESFGGDVAEAVRYVRASQKKEAV